MALEPKIPGQTWTARNRVGRGHSGEVSPGKRARFVGTDGPTRLGLRKTSGVHLGMEITSLLYYEQIACERRYIVRKRASLFKLPVQNPPRPMEPLKTKLLPIPAIDEESSASQTRYEQTTKARRSCKAR